MDSLNSDRILRTPSPPMVNIEYPTQYSSSNGSAPFNDLTDIFNSLPLPSSPESLQNTQTIPSDDLQTLKQTTMIMKRDLRRQTKSTKKLETHFRKQEESIARIETTLERRGEENRYIISMLEKLTCNNNNNTQRFAQTERNGSEFSLSMDEISTDSRDLGINNPIANPQQSCRMPSKPSESNIERIEECRDEIEPVTTNQPTDPVDQLRLEKNRGKIQIGQWCYEINVGTTDDAPALITPAGSKNQTQKKDNSINYQLSRHLTTAVEIPSKTSKGESMNFALLHPLEKQISGQTDRRSYVRDWLHNNPVLLVFGDHLPDQIRIEIDPVSTSAKGCFRGTFGFYDEQKGYKDSEFRVIKISGSSPTRFELKDLKLVKLCDNKRKNGKTYALTPYPSGEIVDTTIRGPKELNNKYNLREIKLAIRYSENEKSFCTNILSTLENQSDQYCLRILTIEPCINTIFFKNQQCPMEFSIEIPEPLHSTLASGYKWIEASIISKGILNPVYLIDTGNGQSKNPAYINIKSEIFKKRLIIIKRAPPETWNDPTFRDLVDQSQSERQIASSISYDISSNNTGFDLTAAGTNRFQIQFQVVHSEMISDESSKIYYDCFQPWQSEEYLATIVCANLGERMIFPLEQEIVKNTGQKRPNDIECDYTKRLPVYKRQTTSETSQ